MRKDMHMLCLGSTALIFSFGKYFVFGRVFSTCFRHDSQTSSIRLKSIDMLLLMLRQNEYMPNTNAIHTNSKPANTTVV